MAIPALPSAWSTYNASQKVNWFLNNGVTTYDLLQAGWITSDDVPWFEAQGMGSGEPPAPPPVQQEPVYYDSEPVYEEPYYEEPVYEEPVYTPPVYTPPPAPVYNIFGLQWNSAAPLSTKQGYVQTLLQAGITGDQIKAKIAELDPANANQAAYDLLGIPSAPPPPPSTSTSTSTSTGLLGTGATNTSTSLLGSTTSAPSTTTASTTSTAPTTSTTTTPTTSVAPVYDFYGLQWDSGSSLATKQSYIQTLLNAGITPQQIKARIAEVDPANATQEAYTALGIPADAPRNTSQDAVTLMAATLGLGLPPEWQYYTGQDKVNWFNANKVTAQTLRDYKVPESDIAEAVRLGLGQTTAPPPSWQLPAGMTLPASWNQFTGQQKVDWYNQNKVTADMLRAMGVPETDVQGAIALGLGQTTTQPPAGTTQPPRTFNPADYMPPTFNLPATNFVPFATGGGQTSLAAPTTGFFYKTTPTEQVPFQFQSGAAGYTNLRPMTLEFGIPQAVSQVQQFQPGYFNQAGILQNYDWAKTNTQLAQQAAQQAQQAANEQVQSGAAMGGKIVGFTDYEEKPDGEVGYEKGGKIRSLLGPNPDGPDEGYAKLQRGEYVVRRKAVNKYGEDFLEALNEARMPKEKLKSLL
jgi:hypothetical protein